jgi:hypothetical protein
MHFCNEFLAEVIASLVILIAPSILWNATFFLIEDVKAYMRHNQQVV